MSKAATRARACAAACLCVAVAGGCMDGHERGVVNPPAGRVQAVEARADVGATRVAADVQVAEPFATAGRERRAIIETLTRHGEPLEVGAIDVPKGWSIAGMDALGRDACLEAPQCVLWQAVSPDGASRMMLLSPLRAFEEPERGQGGAQSRIALAWLRPPDDAMQVDATATVSDTVPAMAAATRRGWTAGGAWLSIAYEAFGTPMRELRALDVETGPGGGRVHRVQGWPILVLRMPAEHYDASAAEAVRRSLRIEPEWVAQWWLAWESRTIRERCKRGYVRGMCHIEEGYADYFRDGVGMGLWDVRSESPYALPAEQRYDASAKP